MKLDLAVPADWQQAQTAEGTLFGCGAGQPAIHMLVTPIVAGQVDPERWLLRAVMYRIEPGFGEPRDPRLTPFALAAGWSGIRLDARIGTQDRMAIYLQFFEYGLTIVAMCLTPDAIPDWRDRILAVVQASTPTFISERSPALTTLLQGMPTRTTTSDRRVRHPLVAWTRGFAGADLVLSARHRPEAASVRVSLGRAPLLPPAAFFAPRVAGAHDGEGEISDPRIDVTDEGEYFVIGNARTPTTQHTLAIVYGDTHYAHIEGLAVDPALFDETRATVRELAYATTLGLGAGRWRRYFYTPPPGWVGIAQPHSTLWISPEDPRHHFTLRVFDARPPLEHERLHGTRMFETLSQEFFVEAPKGPVTYYTAEDLECRVFVHTARFANLPQPIRILDGCVVTEHYVYPLRLHFVPDLLERATAVFEAVVASLHTIPERRATTEAAEGVLSYWAE